MKGAFMQRKDRLLEKRAWLVAQLAQYSDAISGNLGKSAVPPRSDNYYWRITWKEKQKTKVQYVRPEDLDFVRKGTEHFTQLKKLIQEIGDINRRVVLTKNKSVS
jgi:hypothetical protein